MSTLASDSNASLDPLSLEAFLEDGNSEEASQVETASNAKRQRTEDSTDSSDTRARKQGLHGSSGLFSILPPELSLQLLERLSAVDLNSISQTCRFFSCTAQANELWRPLYTCRWPEGMRENVGSSDQFSWKANYMERDKQRGEQVMALIPEKILQTSYLQSLVAERHKTVRRMPQNQLPLNKLLWSRITRWRGARGLLTCPCPGLGSGHEGCSQRGPFAELFGGVYMCESCGWAHQCGDGCPEKLVDEVSESLVCPVSGRCFDRVMLDCEDDGRDELDGDGGCDFGIAGHWGRAYSSGYNCSSEEELRRQCGVVI